MPDHVKYFVRPEKQESRLGKCFWSVPRLIHLAKDLTVMDVPLAHIGMYYTYDKLTLRELAGHMVAVNEASMECPIILDEDGEIMDGRHRLMNAIINQHKTIKAVRFENNPSPCRIEEGSA